MGCSVAPSPCNALPILKPIVVYRVPCCLQIYAIIVSQTRHHLSPIHICPFVRTFYVFILCIYIHVLSTSYRIYIVLIMSSCHVTLSLTHCHVILSYTYTHYITNLIRIHLDNIYVQRNKQQFITVQQVNTHM